MLVWADDKFELYDGSFVPVKWNCKTPRRIVIVDECFMRFLIDA